VTITSLLNSRLMTFAAVLGIIALVILSWVPGDLRPPSGAGRTLEHAGAYLLVAMVLTAGCVKRVRILSALGLVMLALVLEVGQLWIPGRDAAVRDFLASSVGAVTGWIVAEIVLAYMGFNAGRLKSPAARDSITS
jgi:VanZ family protein